MWQQHSTPVICHQDSATNITSICHDQQQCCLYLYNKKTKPYPKLVGFSYVDPFLPFSSVIGWLSANYYNILALKNLALQLFSSTNYITKLNNVERFSHFSYPLGKSWKNSHQAKTTPNIPSNQMASFQWWEQNYQSTIKKKQPAWWGCSIEIWQ